MVVLRSSASQNSLNQRTTSAIVAGAALVLHPFRLSAPLWQRLYAPSVARLLNQYRGTIQWPGAAMLEIITGLLPAMLFVWLGLFIYALVRRQSLNITPAVALLSLNVGACL